MINPRTRFKAQPLARTWADIVDSPTFHDAAATAFVTMQLSNSAPPDMASAAAFQFRLEGAKQFLSILMSLTDPEQAGKLPSSLNLNHKA